MLIIPSLLLCADEAVTSGQLTSQMLQKQACRQQAALAVQTCSTWFQILPSQLEILLLRPDLRHHTAKTRLPKLSNSKFEI